MVFFYFESKSDEHEHVNRSKVVCNPGTHCAMCIDLSIWPCETMQVARPNRERKCCARMRTNYWRKEFGRNLAFQQWQHIPADRERWTKRTTTKIQQKLFSCVSLSCRKVDSPVHPKFIFTLQWMRWKWIFWVKSVAQLVIRLQRDIAPSTWKMKLRGARNERERGREIARDWFWVFAARDHWIQFRLCVWCIKHELYL